MEDINRVTQEQLTQLRGGFFDKVKANDPGFHPDDLERVKTDELWLRRFIAHGEQDVETALQLLYECVQWRKEFGVNELDHTKMDAALFEKGTLFIRNKDKFGKKLLIFKAKHHQKGTVDMEQLQKFIVYYFERKELVPKKLVSLAISPKL
ncbi:Motile sperm domain-containing protein 2 [Orchesella cincta]|uniref:Motile sperm domain-containing protein 2 n=1 Tax=Orchesella cincta TaxID=48709 RepID=A0A1D2MJA5_ORCCI|nr:Motile sperm domain-containing protein 2 [Orchesella cincta]